MSAGVGDLKPVDNILTVLGFMIKQFWVALLHMNSETLLETLPGSNYLNILCNRDGLTDFVTDPNYYEHHVVCFGFEKGFEWEGQLGQDNLQGWRGLQARKEVADMQTALEKLTHSLETRSDSRSCEVESGAKKDPN
eukprot:1523207-Amphidinium_carterae.1